MEGLEITWDARKAARNRAKHGVTFHSYRHGSTIRIISARKANREEQSQYEGFKHA